MNAGKIGKLSAENLLSMDNAEKSRKERSGLWQALGLAWNLGYIIALPLVVFALGLPPVSARGYFYFPCGHDGWLDEKD